MIVERGDHGALYRGGGLYRRLYDLQFRDEPVTVLEPSAPLP
jgi:hypothetical protein